MFYNRSNTPATIPAPECTKEIDTFSLEIGKDGKKELVKSGKTNIYEKIQASKDATLVYNIVDRYNKGDLNALNQAYGAYGDFTNVPTSLADAQQKIIDAEQTFYSLPLEVRKEFNFSSTEFLASIADGTYQTRLAKYGKVKEETTTTTPVVPTTNTQSVESVANQVVNEIVGGNA